MPNPIFKNTLIGSTPKPSPMLPVRDFGKRNDGTPKGNGWLGLINLGGGNVATEYTMQSDMVRGDEGELIDFPTLVPTLTPDEVNIMKDVILNKKPIPEPIIQKAIKHANKQINAGKSVFIQPKTMVDRVSDAIQIKPSYMR